jgi:hypothetical protein
MRWPIKRHQKTPTVEQLAERLDLLDNILRMKGVTLGTPDVPADLAAAVEHAGPAEQGVPLSVGDREVIAVIGDEPGDLAETWNAIREHPAS